MLPRRTLANAIRVLSIDAVEKAKSGHPGMPMGMADIAEVLWRDFLKHNPVNPHWFDRDRFVLSNGHGCMLLYSLLHLTGYDLFIDDLKQFRQFHSKTPGHPEYGFTPGVEATAGPLGQGLAMAVGMAIAEKKLAAEFNVENHVLVDHYTYVFAGDGCLMEGISHEACSLAGTLKLGKLIVFYDDNGISIDGNLAGWFSDNTVERFKAYHWQVISDVDGHDADAIKQAIIAAKNDLSRPAIICCKTKIGFGAPNLMGSEKCHGSPLGETESALAKKELDWRYAPFEIPADIYAEWDAKKQGEKMESQWSGDFVKYQVAFPEKAALFLRRMTGLIPPDFEINSNAFICKIMQETKPQATRKISQACIEYYSQLLPELMGGSADLSESNNTKGKNTIAFSAENSTGNYLHYGVREFGMSAIMNGLALHNGVIPFGGTFLTFADYAKNAVRMSALMQQKVIYVYSHDSIGLGEDGPTHQPIEQIAMLRMIPHFEVWRPCDFTETAIAWQQMLTHSGPSALLLTRQNLPMQTHSPAEIKDIARGGYIVFEPVGKIVAIILATGSEVYLAVDAAKELIKENIFVRVVSMPCCERFKSQNAAYREKILPDAVRARLAIEAGIPDYWYQFVGSDGAIIGINTFGASAPADVLWKAYGFTVENVKKQILNVITDNYTRRTTMTIKIAINGFGRIGRNITRALYESDYRDRVQLVAINDLGDLATNAHLLKYDSVHGRFAQTVSTDDHDLIIGDDHIRVFSEKNPALIPWGELNIDVVLECTGFFTSREKANAHLQAGAKKVLISAPAGKDIPTIVYGVNHLTLKSSDDIVSNASCTTNCLAPMAKILHETVGIRCGLMTTVHSYTADQKLNDAAHPDLRRARAAALSMIPTKTGAAAAVGLVLPELAGKLDGYAVRVPTANVSLVDLTFEALRPATVESINAALKTAAEGELSGILSYSDLPLVSIDYNHCPASSTVDALETRVIGNLVKVISWYDNEWGFSNRMLDTASVMMQV